LGCSGEARPPSLLLLITADTLRADRLAAWGGERSVTPNLDALARESVTFLNTYAPAPFTLPSVSGILTGRYPEEVGIRSNESVLDASVPTLASALRERGWRTVAIVGNWILHGDSGLAAGFDEYDDDFPEREMVRGFPERVARSATDQMLPHLDRCLASNAPPCFLWIHYQDPHGPYTPEPERLARHLSEHRASPDGLRELPVRPDHRGKGGIPDYQVIGEHREVAYYRAAYDGEVETMDEQIGRLLDRVRRSGALDRSVVVFTADHGESLGEQDWWFAHGEHLTDVLLRVPLLMRIPGAGPDVRHDTVSLVDVLPTLLGVLTGGAGELTLTGRDLLAPGALADEGTAHLSTLGSARPPRHGVVAEGFKLVLNREGGRWHDRLTRPGAEARDLTNDATQFVAPLRRQLNEHRRRMAQGPPEVLRPAPSPREAEYLKALGYLERMSDDEESDEPPRIEQPRPITR